jgi:protein O-GlcNAc transferase
LVRESEDQNVAKSDPFQLEQASRLKDAGRLQESEALCLQFVASSPQNALGFHLLGVVQCQLGKTDEGMTKLKRALELEPTNADIQSTYGAMLGQMGDHQGSVKFLLDAVRLGPLVPRCHYNLGVTLERLEKWRGAERAYRRAIELKSDYAEAHAHLAGLLIRQGHLVQALHHCDVALRQRPNLVPAVRHRAMALAEQGRMKEVLACRRRLLEIAPRAIVDHSNYLVTLFYDPDVSLDQYKSECCRWDQIFGNKPRPTTYSNARDPERPLRIGYASAQFSFHVVGRLLLPLLRHHDRSAYGVYCYCANDKHDANTERFRPYATGWREIRRLPLTRVVEMIQADQIDILVDTIGHFGGSLLPVFVRKPAPIQVTHFGHFSTTGVAAFDYRFTDSLSDPPGTTEAYHVERLVRLDPCAFCYLPEDPVPPAAPLPMLRNGFVTFGCLCNFIKVSEPCVDLWCRVLKAIPQSKLLLLAPGDRESQQYTVERFGRRGIDPGRLELVSKCSHQEYLKRFDRIDIALDTFPYNGDNTTCDGMWCGVPVLTLAGDWAVARRGLSHLTALDLPEWIAYTPDEFVKKAVAFVAEPGKLAALRQGLRDRMLHSPLCAAAEFAERVEAAYRAMWREWCNRPQLNGA